MKPMSSILHRNILRGVNRSLAASVGVRFGGGIAPMCQSASGRRMTVAKTQTLQQRRRIIFKTKNPVPPRVVGYYVLFPAIPDENSENNAFIANIERNEDWPALSSASAREMYEGTIRMLMEYGATVYEHGELLEKDKAIPRDFETVLAPLLVEEYDIDYAFNTLILKMMTDWPDCANSAFTVDLHHLKNMVSREHFQRFARPAVRNALKTIYENTEELSADPWKQRLVEWYLLELCAIGADETDEKKANVISSWGRMITEFSTKYITDIMCTNDQNIYPIADRKVLKHAPPHILKLLAGENSSDPETGPWRGIMEPASLYALMKYCGDRDVRAQAWDRWISKASFEHDFYNNSVIVEELRHNNEGLAKSLGYSSIAEHHLANKMAGTPQTVRSFINELIRRIRPVFVDRTQSWSHYATNKEMIGGSLRVSDLFYLCPREAEAHYATDTLELMKYFPFWRTFQNATELLFHLLNITFEDISNQNLERCNHSVRIYAVADRSSGEHLGRLYIDPFSRAGKRGNWNTFLGRPANSVRKLDKLVYMIGAANEPNQSGTSLLHHTQLQHLLFNLGRAVQMLLSQSPYRDLTIPWAPRFAADWDGADYFPKFVEFFVYKPNLLKALSSPHVETGEELTDANTNDVVLALSRSTLWDTYRTLFWSDYDLSICELEDRRKAFWFDLYREMYSEYFPFPRERSDYQPCSFLPIMVQPFMGMYYRKLWTEMLALDVHETFDRERDERSTGERLKHTVLYRGAGDLQSELFRQFQSRDPSVGAICDFHDPPAQIED